MFSSLESQGLRSSHPLGPVEHPSRRHQLGADRQRVLIRQGAERLPLPDAALRRQHRRRGVLQPEQQRLRRLSQAAACSRRTGYPAFGPAYMNDPRNPPLRYGRHDNGQAANTTACRSAPRHRVADAVRPQRRWPGRSVGAAARRIRPRRQGHASVRRARQPSAHRLVAGAGQSSVHVTARWSTAAST